MCAQLSFRTRSATGATITPMWASNSTLLQRSCPPVSGYTFLFTPRPRAERYLGDATLPTAMTRGGKPIYSRFCALAAEAAADYARRNRTGTMPGSVPAAP